MLRRAGRGLTVRLTHSFLWHLRQADKETTPADFGTVEDGNGIKPGSNVRELPAMLPPVQVHSSTFDVHC